MKTRIVIMLLMIAVCAALPASAQQKQRDQKQRQKAQRVPDGVKLVRDIEYARVGDISLTLDIYMPENANNPPLLMWIHGGGWRNGSKDRTPLKWLVSEGYALASINYRLSGAAMWPAQMHDCKAAVRFLRAKAADYGYNAQRIGVAGSSAGGHLVAVLGTSGGVSDLEGGVGNHADQSSRVQAVVDLYGPTNFIAMIGKPSRINHAAAQSPESLLVGGAIEQHPDRVRSADPITYVTRDDPPFLILHGTDDPAVPISQSEILHEALKRAEIESTYHAIEGAGHGGPEFQDETRRAMIKAFFDRHIRRPPTPQ